MLRLTGKLQPVRLQLTLHVQKLQMLILQLDSQLFLLQLMLKFCNGVILRTAVMLRVLPLVLLLLILTLGLLVPTHQR